MDLKQRLGRFDQLSRKTKPGLQEPVADGGGAERSLGPSVKQAAHMRRELGLRRRAVAGGRIWFRDYPPVAALREPANLPDFRAVFSGAAPVDLKPRELLFLDTETTGLVGGTGSLAFLIGVAWWSREGLRARQYFLPGPGKELPLLTALQDLARPFRAILTYNGNCFDLPLLRTRYLLSRLDDPFAGMTSWDILPAARRLWRRRLPDCRQQTIESAICGAGRAEGDIEGWLIPQVYFRFVREGDWDQLRNVLIHNRRDLEGMARIFGAIRRRAAVLDAPGVRDEAGWVDHWQDAWSNGRICEARGRTQIAADWMELALRLGPFAGRWQGQDDSAERFFADAVRILKRTSIWHRVEAIIRIALLTLGPRAWVHREAAILYEHRLLRLPEAWHHAQQLDDPHRRARLRRKLDRAAAGTRDRR